ncbi:MAG: mechanosensitive ion channel family protein, partial [Persicimonas sp.]
MEIINSLIASSAQFFSGDNLQDYIIALLICVVGYVLSRLLAKGVERFLRRKGNEHGAAVAGKLVFYPLVLFAVFGALTHLGVKLTGLLAAAGVLTVAIGFAAQTSVSNVISGLFLLIDRP